MGRRPRRDRKTHRVLGIDIGLSMGWTTGLSKPGESVERVDGGTWKIKPSPNRRKGSRWTSARRYLRHTIVSFKPTVVAFENVARHRGTEAAHVFGALKSLVEEICAEFDIPLVFYYPTTIKKQVTGDGRATKPEVAAAAGKLLGVREFSSEDESDSAGVMITAIKLGGTMEL